MVKHKRNKHVKSQQKARELEISRRAQINEEQETEYEAVLAIYPEIITRCDELESYEHPYVFSAHITPHPYETFNSSVNRCFLVLMFKFTREYPYEPLVVSILNSENVTDEQESALFRVVCRVIQDPNKRGVPVVFDVITSVQELLYPINVECIKSDRSVYDAMIEAQNQIEEEKEEIVEDAEESVQACVEENPVQLTLEEEKELRKQWLRSMNVDNVSDDLYGKSAVGSSYPVGSSDPASAKREATEALSPRAIEAFAEDSVADVFVSLLLRRSLGTSAPNEELSARLWEYLCEKKIISERVLGILSESGASNKDVLKHVILESLPGSGDQHLDNLLRFLCDFNDFSSATGQFVQSTSRYRKDFVEIEILGKGSFGEVMKVQNRLDGRFYAVKRVPMHQDAQAFHRILREVSTLSQLHHQYVLRYFQAWIETATTSDAQTLDLPTDTELDWMTPEITGDWGLHSDSLFHERIEAQEISSEIELNADESEEFIRASTFEEGSSEDQVPASPTYYLYIQTEYCERTLRETIHRQARNPNADDIWRRFRQILEGLVHIHSNGILHRDLKPNNIFHDPAGDVRIGDLGLATFGTNRVGSLSTTSEYVPNYTPEDVGELAGEHTAGVGTFFYTAPEQLDSRGRASVYDERCDLYALGIIFFEMWYPFSTAHERVSTLNALRTHGTMPDGFDLVHPRQCKIIRWLLSASPEDRPTASQLLQSSLLPPRMEDEYMKDAVRTIASPHSLFYRKLLEELFKKDRPMPFVFTGSQFATKQREGMFPSEDQLEVMAIMERVFVQHCAQRVMSPMIVPLGTKSERTDKAAVFLDRCGCLVKLRSDLKESLLRHVINSYGNKRAVLTRRGRVSGDQRLYEFGNVFRAREDSTNGSQLSESLQAEFTLYTSAEAMCQGLMLPVEAISVADQVMGDCELRRGSINIGHSVLARELLEYCKVDTSDSALLQTLGRCFNGSAPVNGRTVNDIASLLMTVCACWVPLTCLDDRFVDKKRKQRLCMLSNERNQ